MNLQEDFIIDRPYSLKKEDEQVISKVLENELSVNLWKEKSLNCKL